MGCILRICKKKPEPKVVYIGDLYPNESDKSKCNQESENSYFKKTSLEKEEDENYGYIKDSNNEDNVKLLLKKCNDFLDLFPKINNKKKIEYLNKIYTIVDNENYTITICVKSGELKKYILEINNSILSKYKQIEKIISKFKKILDLDPITELINFQDKLGKLALNGKLNLLFKNGALIFKFEIEIKEEGNNIDSSYGIIELKIKFNKGKKKESDKIEKISSNMNFEIFIFLLVILILIIIVEKGCKESTLIENADKILSKENKEEKNLYNNFGDFQN